jgi:hypothetical protein
MTRFVVVAIFKNETRNLKEWIEHYLWQGASHIYLCDHESTDNPLEILQPYRSYTHSIQALPNPPEWILIADLDEFWYGEEKLLKDVLTEYPESVHVIYRTWRIFAPSEDGFQPMSLRKELVNRKPVETSPKFIFRTNSVNPENVWIHEVRNIPAEHEVRETTRLHCNHYYCQSLEYWNTVKIPRGHIMGDLYVYNCMNMFYDNAEGCTLLDTTLADKVRKFEEEGI